MGVLEEFAGWDGKEVSVLEAAYAAHASGPTFVDGLCDGLEGPDAVQTAASWLLKRFLEEGGALRGAHLARVLSGLEGLRTWEARLHVLQCLPYLTLPARAKRPLERFVREALASDVKFVQAWAYTGLHALARRFEDLRPEMEALFQKGYTTGPASVRARIRNLRKEGL